MSGFWFIALSSVSRITVQQSHSRIRRLTDTHRRADPTTCPLAANSNYLSKHSIACTLVLLSDALGTNLVRSQQGRYTGSGPFSGSFLALHQRHVIQICKKSDEERAAGNRKDHGHSTRNDSPCAARRRAS